MARARDKLQEAEFFLDKAHQTRVVGSEFRYYFNASVSAFRAISLVLQKDYRGIYGEQFDDWWARTWAQPPLSALDFKTLTNVRNVSQKEGSRFPLVILSGQPGKQLKELVEKVEIVEDQSTSTRKAGMQSIKVTFKASHPLLSITTGNEVPGEEADRLMEQRFVEILQQITCDLDLTIEASGLRLEEDGPTFAPKQLLAMLDDHAKAWRQVLDDAEQQFRPST
jgi:hypothetical protein